MNGYRMNLAVLLLSSMLPAGISMAAAPETDGAATFAQRCVKCHSLEKVRTEIMKRPVAEREAHLKSFMQKHFPAPADSRAALLAYLVNTASR